MRKARTSNHRGKNGSATHNMHAFKGKDKDIFLYWKTRYQGIEISGKTIEEREIDFYKKAFTPMLEEQNDKYRAKRNYDRVKTIKDIYKSKRYKPTEEIVQYGGVGDKVPDKDTYIKMIKEYYKAKEVLGKGYVVVLSAASHFDEATPHTHFREIWLYKDDKGIMRLGQEEALKRAGIGLPKPNEPESRYNNRMMTYTSMCREKWQDICESYGYPVERTPKPVKKRHQTVKEYQDEASIKYFNEREEDIKTREIALNALKSDLEAREEALNKEIEKYKDKQKECDTKQSEALQAKQKYISLSKQLKNKEIELNEREKALDERSKKIRGMASSTENIKDISNADYLKKTGRKLPSYSM
jgi:hypothetical protein